MRRIAILKWVSGIVLAGGALLQVGCFAGEGGGEEEAEQPLNGVPGCDGGCTTEVLGDGSTCEPIETLKLPAYEACKAQGLVPVDIVFADDGCGAGSTSQATVTCCAPPPPPPPPPPGVCTGQALGDGSVCETSAYWKDQAYQVCAAQGLIVADMALALDCGADGSSYAKVLCCGDVQPPDPDPNPPVCTYDVLGDGSVCQAPELWKAEAVTVCESQGLFLAEMSLSAGDCADGGASAAKFACCGNATPPDPGQPPACTYGAIGDGSVCQEANLWQAEAVTICESQGLSLTDISLALGDCANGGASYAKFACCEP